MLTSAVRSNSSHPVNQSWWKPGRRKILCKVLQWSINIWSATWETGGRGERAAAEVEEVDEETLSGYQSGVKVPLEWQLHLVPSYSPLLFLPLTLGTLLNPHSSPPSHFRNALLALCAHQLAVMPVLAAGKPAGDICNHCKSLKSIWPCLVLAGLFRCRLCILQPGRCVAQHQRPILRKHRGLVR